MSLDTRPGVGAASAIAVGEQTTFETPVRPTHAIDFTSEGVQGSETVIQSEAITGDRGRKFVGRGNISVAGEIAAELAADGFSILLRHALGDYITTNAADGGLHARVEGASQVLALTGGHSFQNTEIIPLADEVVAQFPAASAVTHIFKDVNGDLQEDPNQAYSAMNRWDLTYIQAINNNDTDTDAAAAFSITLQPNNQGVNARVNADAGILEFRQGGVAYSVRYYDAQDLGGGLTKVFLDPAQIAVLAAPGTGVPAVDDVVVVKPALTTKNASFSFGTTPARGDWFLHYDATYTDVYTHVIMAGNQLPAAGLTIEADRDAAVFLYSGAKISTLTVNFEPDAFVTSSFSFVARREHGEAQLQADAIPGATEIFIDDADHWQFVDPTVITATKAFMVIDERTNISYTTKEVDYNGTGQTRLSGIPASGDEAIEEVFLKDSSVGALTSTGQNTLYEGVTTPLVMWMASLYMQGQFEEGLSGNFTLENNINTDKFGFGSQYVFATVEERRDITTTITVEFDDMKHVTRYKKGVHITQEFRCVSANDDADIGDSDVPAQMHFFFPRVRLTSSTPTVDSTSYITHDLSGVGLDDASYNTPGLVAFVVNGQQYDVAAP